MRNLLSLIMVLVLAGFLSACLDKKEDSPENTSENTEETTDESTNESNDGTSSGEESDEGVTDGIGDPKYGVNVIPSGFKGYKGRPVEAASWTDSNGDNLVIITETSETEKQGENGGMRSKELYGYHYIMDGSDGDELWKIQDFVKECEFDLALSYIPESLTITDLDGNGIGESSFMYKLGCKSDVSPDDLKLMMHEGKTKYALRGYTFVLGVGGDYKVDKAFNDAPDSFLDYAKKQWQKYKKADY